MERKTGRWNTALPDLLLCSVGFLYGLGIDFDLDVFAEHYTPRFKGFVVTDAVVLAVHFGLCLQADASHSHRVFDRAAELHGQADLFSDAMHREITHEHGLVSLFLGAFALES